MRESIITSTPKTGSRDWGWERREVTNGANQLWTNYGLILSNFFGSRPEEYLILELGYIPDRAGIREAWLMLVPPFLEGSGLEAPDEFAPVEYPRSDHTEQLDRLLIEMQEVARLDPEANW